MSLSTGARLGAYEVLGPLGAGGMGEVYRARDAKLHRDVALKILPEAFAADPERLARFEREAHALAALTHPHIATIYGMHEERAEGGRQVRALVLEFVEGETLADRIVRGPMPAGEAIGIARQIAEALEAAHEQGIVHRDLKPANIKITSDGHVKVLDFGLAKLQSADGSATIAQQQLSMSPTITTPAIVTGVSVLLGTAAYMAPEQARGRPVDKRADIWAFGVVVYEMLTGRQAFAGESITEVVGAVIHKEVDLNALPATTPQRLVVVLRQCLQKDPKQRIRDMGDVRLLLNGALTVPEPVAAVATATPRKRSPIALLVATLVAAVAAGGAVWFFTRTEPLPRYPVRFAFDAPDATTVSVGADISPDGRHVVFLEISGDRPRLWVHSLESSQSRILSGIEFAQRAAPPFWSPDGRFLCIWTNNRLLRVDVAGGPVETLLQTTIVGGGSWSASNIIVFSDLTKGVMRIPASGGMPVAVTVIDASRQETTHLMPSFLPDGRYFLYSRLSKDPQVQGIYIGDVNASPEQQEKTRLLVTNSQAVYAGDGADSGYILFVRDGLLMGQPFDARTRTLTGEAAPVLQERVAAEGGLGWFSASARGVLAYRGAVPSVGTLVAVNRRGETTTLLDGAKLERAINPKLSPDGRRLAMIVAGSVWAYDLAGRPPIRLTFEAAQFSPIWTPDGTRVVYEQGGSGGPASLFAVPSDGSGGTAAQVAPPGHYHPHGWTATGDLVVARLDGGDVDLVHFAPRPDAKVEILQDTPALEGLSASVSPDGRWVAYPADSTGRFEIWVRPLSGTGAAVRVSPNGGSEPVWAKNGGELYYREGDKMMAVAVDAGAAFNFKPAVELFKASIVEGPQPPSYDVTADGRFVFVKPDQTRNVPVSVVLNWPELLRNRAAAQ